MLNRRLGLAIALGLTLLAPSSFSFAADQTDQRPNVILFLIDDLGWTDLGCFGSDFYETPNIDRLAQRGMRFTDAYAACTVCSPTRAAIMTGKYPARLHLTDWISGHDRKNPKLLIPDWNQQLELEEITLAEALKSAGYATAHVGKWHLGEEPFYPEHQGFDLNVGGDHWGAPGHYFWPYQRVLKDKTIQRRVPLDGGEPGEYLTDRLTDEAIRFIDSSQDRPFFLNFAHYAVHTPLQAKKELIAHYRAKLRKIKKPGKQRNAVYAAMIHSVDESIGRILDTLRRLKLDERTIVLFTSDNGGLIPVTSNLPLRVGKGSAYEGGVRVPLIVDWPGATKPGSICQTPVLSIDYYPTILDIVGQAIGQNHQPDGKSLVPLLKQTGTLQRDAIYWHYPHYHPGGATPHSAIRQGDFRLVEFHEDNHVELYDLNKDLGEKNDLSKTMPAKTRALHKRLDDWRAAVDAQMPRPKSRLRSLPKTQKTQVNPIGKPNNQLQDREWSAPPSHPKTSERNQATSRRQAATPTWRGMFRAELVFSAQFFPETFPSRSHPH